MPYKALVNLFPINAKTNDDSLWANLDESIILELDFHFKQLSRSFFLNVRL